MKIVFIGGGAYAWTSELVRDIAVTPSLHGSEICLMDIDSEPLKLTAELSRKVVEVAGAGIGITSTTDQDAALTGADCVVVAINTGAWQAMAQDLEVPLKYGIRHSVSDTVGPGGISRALRNVPVLDGIARRVHEVCPRAWLINLTNPMSTLTRVMRAGHDRTVGYCHEIEWLRLRLAHRFNVPREKIHAVTVGVNHMTWVMELHVAGNPSGLEMLREDVARRGVLDDRGKPTPIVQELYELFGALPVSLDGHIAEFYGPYARPEISDRYHNRQREGHEEFDAREKARKKVLAMIAGAEPICLEHSMEQVSEAIAALAGHGAFVGVGNLPNTGQVPNLPPGAVIETEVTYDRDSVKSRQYPPLRPVLVSSIIQHCLSQELIVEAALKGDRRLVIEALLTQPHIQDFAIVRPMVEDMLQANRQYLPRFFDGKEKG